MNSVMNIMFSTISLTLILFLLKFIRSPSLYVELIYKVWDTHRFYMIKELVLERRFLTLLNSTLNTLKMCVAGSSCSSQPVAQCVLCWYLGYFLAHFPWREPLCWQVGCFGSLGCWCGLVVGSAFWFAAWVLCGPLWYASI